MRSDLAQVLDAIIEIRDDIVKEIEAKSKVSTGMRAGSNIGKRGCVNRLNKILDEFDTRTKSEPIPNYQITETCIR